MELIDREALMSYPIRLDRYDKKNGNLDFILGIESIFEYIEALPVIDAVPVVHGMWGASSDGITPCCSICGRSHNLMTRTPKFCPNCGAKMDGCK